MYFVLFLKDEKPLDHQSLIIGEKKERIQNEHLPECHKNINLEFIAPNNRIALGSEENKNRPKETFLEK